MIRSLMIGGCVIALGVYACTPSMVGTTGYVDVNKPINADSPLWYSNPKAAAYLAAAQGEDVEAVYASQHGMPDDAAQSLRNAAQDRELAKQALGQ